MSERDESNNREYTNGEITVFWKPSECIHATTCYRDLIQVFNPRKRPWVNMQGASTDEIIKVVDKCPTDALTYKRNSASETITPQDDSEEITPISEEIEHAAEVRVMRDGPLIVKGNFKIIEADGSTHRKMKMVSFCRCGHSGRMPFCDGSHRKQRFSSD